MEKTNSPDLLEPLTPAGCDLRDFAFIPLHVARLRDSDLAIQMGAEEFRAAVLLWCAAWHQVPAASLPDDDKVLAALAGYGRVVSEWRKHREGALYGWVRCSDGRLYHPVVAEKARDAWLAKHKHAHDKLVDRVRKANKQREQQQLPPWVVPPLEEWIAAGFPMESDLFPTESTSDSTGKKKEAAHRSGGNPPENALKGQGQGEGNNSSEEPSGSSGAAAPPKSPDEMTKDELWAAGKSLLSQAGMPAAQCGSFVGKLVKDHGPDVVVDAVRSAVLERPADPASFLKAACQHRAGQRQTPNRQEALEARNREVARRLAAVNDAMGRHCANPDTGQYLPKPADVVRMLQGSTQDGALVAWAKVDRAVRQIGTWQSVVFDDALIHRVLHDMGGWLALERKTEDDWPFVAKEFQNRYHGYRGRSERPDYPPVLVGATQAHNSRVGGDAPAPVLIGDAGQARVVLAGGTTSPLVGFSQVWHVRAGHPARPDQPLERMPLA